MDLRINDEAMRALVSKAIVDSLTDDDRNKLIADAVTQMLTVPQGSGYGPKRSPLQQAFDSACEMEARRYATKIIAEDSEFKKQIESLFGDVAKRIFNSEKREEMIGAIADTITRALTKY